MGFQFAGKAVYTAIWVAAFSLFMELLGFSTQRWLTAGGLGAVLLTLAGREIFKNFLSSIMIDATRPFVLKERIQIKIDVYDVSGTVENVGWWSPTILRGEGREAVYIPNHKFIVSVVRNLSQKTHWRITHLAISHLDVKKINILISCFVKTPRHEEYLCVKETILLDLLRVIGHHRARLATPIRTMQKTLTEAEFGNVPFSDTIYENGTTSNCPLLSIEPSKINGDDKAKRQARSPRATGDNDTKPSTKSAKDRVDAKGETIDPISTTTILSNNHKAKAVQTSDDNNLDLSSRTFSTPISLLNLHLNQSPRME